MKQYQSVSGKCTVKAYYYNQKFCISTEYSDGYTIVAQFPTKDRANNVFKRLKELHPDLVPTK